MLHLRIQLQNNLLVFTFIHLHQSFIYHVPPPSKMEKEAKPSESEGEKDSVPTRVCRNIMC